MVTVPLSNQHRDFDNLIKFVCVSVLHGILLSVKEDEGHETMLLCGCALFMGVACMRIGCRHV